MAWQYYAIMLSGAAVAGGIGVAAAAFSGGAALLAGLLGWLAAALVGANLAGAALIYRPVYRQLAGLPAADGGIERRLGRLPVLSGFWVFSLAAVATFGNSAAHVAGGLDARLLIAAVVHCLVFAAYIGLFTYLLVFDHVVTLRKALSKRGIEFRLPQKRFVTRVAWSLGAVALGPVLVALSDGWLHAGDGGLSRPTAANPMLEFAHQTLQLDVLGALFLATVVGILIARGLSRPMTILLDAMARVDRGDLSTRAPVISDDEFGSLTRRFNQMVSGVEDRDRLRRAFTYFVPESVAATLIADKGAITPQEREATVLFTDIESFTEIASRLAPREVLAMLNDYFAEVAKIINAHGGVITQFQGDAVLACFNLPVADPAHARQAVEAALEIRKRTEEAGFHGGVRLRSRVGVSTGVVVGGMVGGGERLGYTVHGDTVNLAARLEALNKARGTRILLSARTAELVGGAIPLRDLGQVAVRGFSAPVQLFEPVVQPVALDAG
jgi:class 3 adenylate cyclase